MARTSNPSRPTRYDEIPQDVALRFQLIAFAGGANAGYFEIRAKRLAGRPGMEQEFVSVHEPARAARCALNLGQMSDAYIGAAIRTRRSGGLDAIESLGVLWADCDSRAALERLSAFRPLPAIVIRSGSDDSAHAYWPLQEPVTPAWAKRANRRLALALGADRNATDAARVLRPAGGLNFKHDPPRPVVCTRLELDVFAIGEVVGHLPDDRDYVRPAVQPRAFTGDASKLLDGLARTVHEAAVGNRNASLFWAACRVRERVDACELDGVRARHVLREAALAAGLEEHETERTLDSALDTAAAA
jgi:hypothetical protein